MGLLELPQCSEGSLHAIVIMIQSQSALSHCKKLKCPAVRVTGLRDITKIAVVSCAWLKWQLPGRMQHWLPAQAITVRGIISHCRKDEFCGSKHLDVFINGRFMLNY